MTALCKPSMHESRQDLVEQIATGIKTRWDEYVAAETGQSTGHLKDVLCSDGSEGESRPTIKRKPKRTFRRNSLETAFLKFCQLSTETSSAPMSASDFQELQRQASEFIDNPEFTERSAEAEILGDDLLSHCELDEPTRNRKKVELPPHLARLCEQKLLTPGQERALFQRMNYLRYRAYKIIKDHSAETANQWDIERVRGLLRVADWYRDVIVQANIRLVISIVKKFVNQQCGFDDLLSDGIMALIRSVDKFDYQLGFRFSTYATQVVRRNSYRFVMDRQEERLKVTNSISDAGLDIPEESGATSMSEQRWNALRGRLGEYLDQLDKREKFIIRARFSLGGHRRVQTLQRLADKLGVSKERVRQLEKRAMEKLQSMALENPPEFTEVQA